VADYRRITGGLPAVCAGGSDRQFRWAVWMGSLSRDMGSGMAVTVILRRDILTDRKNTSSAARTGGLGASPHKIR